MHYQWSITEQSFFQTSWSSVYRAFRIRGSFFHTRILSRPNFHICLLDLIGFIKCKQSSHSFIRSISSPMWHYIQFLKDCIRIFCESFIWKFNFIMHNAFSWKFGKHIQQWLSIECCYMFSWNSFLLIYWK